MAQTAAAFGAECPDPPFYYKEAATLLPPPIPNDPEGVICHYGSLFAVQQNQLKLDQDTSSLKQELLNKLEKVLAKSKHYLSTGALHSKDYYFQLDSLTSEFQRTLNDYRHHEGLQNLKEKMESDIIHLKTLKHHFSKLLEETKEKIAVAPKEK